MGLRVRQAAFLVTATHLLVLGGVLVMGLLGESTPPRVIQVGLQPSARPDAASRPPLQAPPPSGLSPAALAAPAAPAAPRSPASPKTATSPVLPPVPVAAQSPATPAAGSTPSFAPAASAAASVSGARAAESAADADRNAAGPSATGRATTDDRQPTIDASYRGNPPPVYPVISRRLGEQGVVVLRVLIDADGRAVDVQIQRSSGSGRLDQAAVQAIQEWRFIPARRGGKPVSEWYEWRWEFRLSG